MIKKVYICSPFRGNREENVKKAKEYSKWVYNQGYLPICVHIYLEEATGMDEKNGDRTKLIQLGMEMMKMCDEIWVFGDKISEGMAIEIREAEKEGIKIVGINEMTKKIKQIVVLGEYES